MDTEDGDPSDQIGTIDHDLAVEPSRTEECRVEDVGPVGAGDDDHTRLRLEPVELDQQLVEGLLPLVVAATETGTTMTAHRVDLVDEDDGRGVVLGLLEEVAHPGGADADEHLDEVRPEMEKKGTPASPATALASSVFRSPVGRREDAWGSWHPWRGTCPGAGGTP